MVDHSQYLISLQVGQIGQLRLRSKCIRGIFQSSVNKAIARNQV